MTTRADGGAPLMRSMPVALALGACAGAALGVWQARAWGAAGTWQLAGGAAGAVLGAISAGDLLIPGPGPERSWSRGRGRRIGPFRTGALLLALLAEGLAIAALLAGSTTLTCGREASGVSCRRTMRGWLGEHTVSERVYAPVTGAGLDVWSELVLYHGPEGHGETAAGFGDEARGRVQQVLTGATPGFSQPSDTWRSQIAAPAVAALAVVAGVFAVASLRAGLRALPPSRR